MHAQRILVIKYGAIGDFIAGTIAIVALRKAFPDAHITLLSKAANRAICPPGNIIQEFWDVGELKTGALGYPRLLLKMRNGRFDIAINLRWNSEILSILTGLSGARLTAGISRNWTRHLYKKTVNDITDFDNRHEYLKNTDPLRALGIPLESPEAYVHITAEDEGRAGSALQKIQPPFIVMCPTASNTLKAWPPERYVALGRWIWQEYGAPMMLSWAGDAEQIIAEGVAQGIGAGAALLPALSIGGLAAVMQRARMVICNNSGSLHIAFSQKAPTLCFNTSKGWEPWGAGNVALNVFHDEPGFNLADTTNEMAAAQLATISVEDAQQAFAELWGRALRFWPRQIAF